MSCSGFWDHSFASCTRSRLLSRGKHKSKVLAAFSEQNQLQWLSHAQVLRSLGQRHDLSEVTYYISLLRHLDCFGWDWAAFFYLYSREAVFVSSWCISIAGSTFDPSHCILYKSTFLSHLLDPTELPYTCCKSHSEQISPSWSFLVSGCCRCSQWRYRLSREDQDQGRYLCCFDRSLRIVWHLCLLVRLLRCDLSCQAWVYIQFFSARS